MIVESVQSVTQVCPDGNHGFPVQKIVFKLGGNINVKQIGVFVSSDNTTQDEVFDEWMWQFSQAARKAAYELGEDLSQADRLSAHDINRLFGASSPREVYEAVTPARQWQHNYTQSEVQV